jgi:hypothetical protein
MAAQVIRTGNAVVVRVQSPTLEEVLAKLETLEDKLDLLLGGGIYVPPPTPTPAPVFTTQPSVSPGSGTAGTTTFTANNGVASNATGYTRRWLLNGSAIGTGATILPDAAGSLVLEVTATGPTAPPAVVTSAAVTVAAASVPGPSAPTLVLESPAGTNPPKFGRTFGDNTYPESNYWLAREWADNSSFTGSKTRRVFIDTQLMTDGDESVDWSTMGVGDPWPVSFPPGSSLYVREWVVRDPTGTPTTSPKSNVITASIAEPQLSFAKLGTYNLDYGYGSTPPPFGTPVAIAAGDKLYVYLEGALNGSSISSVSANNGAIVFTPIAQTAGNSSRGHYYADTTGVTSLTDVTVNVTGSTAYMNLILCAVRNAAAGGPVSQFNGTAQAAQPSVEIDVDGGLSPATGEKMLISCIAGNGGPGMTSENSTQIFGVSGSPGFAGFMQVSGQAENATIMGAQYSTLNYGVTKWKS